ncbi:NAD-dependent epimerase/dehydratase family protein [Streptomyces stelliscabiei]|uniref:NAD-dependent epimerase/dehydratase family protein n=1 Tax=Streptomyces stelliscabiei TaxID=146820 RepID=UPI002FF3B7A0
MNILVTGASGFIGTHLVRQLTAHDHRVTGIDKRHGRPTTDLAALQKTVDAAQPDVIVHLGASCSTAVSLADPAADFRDNALGTFNVCEAARQAGGVPVLFTSSVKVNAGADGKIAPLGLSKRVGEDYLRLYGDLYGLPSVILRPSTVYGPGQDGSAEAGWVTWFLRATLERRTITVHGDGTQSRDILHIDDFTRLLGDIVENFDAYQGRTYDVGGGPDNEVSLLGLLERIDYSDVRHTERLPGDLQRVVTDNSPVSAVRGWEPAVGWQQGVARTYQWMERTR